ncbi:MAG: M48 family metalloprotease [Smithellaceae bacterium]|nr:M48 family metalloprotease [Smithellaceae bacterium]
MCKIFQKQCFSFILAVLVVFVTTQSAWSAFTIADEKKLGKEIYDKLEKNAFLLHDKKLNTYIGNIGNRILQHSDKAPFDYTFSIFNSSAINAFATPGGYVYINKGLISVVENEAQLAGVIAHEIAHANARHVASIIEKSKKLNLAMMAAVIAAALLGGGGEATAAIATFSIAGAASISLKYRREHEEEADRLGIGYLADAGYYPAAMIEFLKIIKQYEFISKSIPSYLFTHPGTDNRIFYLDSLLHTHYRGGGSRDIVGNFVRMQSLIVLDGNGLINRRKTLTQSLHKDPRNVDLLYALAMTEEQLGHTRTAVDYLNKALSIAPRDGDVLKSIGMISLKTGNSGLARHHLLEASRVNPEDDQITLALGKAHYATGDFQSALECFLKLRDKTLDDADIEYHIAMSYGRLNQQGDSHYYFGLHFKKKQKEDSALFHFQKALEYFPGESTKASSIQNAMKDLRTGKPAKPDKKTDGKPKPLN